MYVQEYLSVTCRSNCHYTAKYIQHQSFTRDMVSLSVIGCEMYTHLGEYPHVHILTLDGVYVTDSRGFYSYVRSSCCVD